eukprot:COSAG01_NODE_12275_length_1768_cov_13.306171_1_plen_175_part_00
MRWGSISSSEISERSRSPALLLSCSPVAHPACFSGTTPCTAPCLDIGMSASRHLTCGPGMRTWRCIMSMASPRPRTDLIVTASAVAQTFQRGLRPRVARLGSVAGRGCYRLRHAACSRHVATGSITASSRHGAMASGELCACVCVCVGKNTFHSAPTQPPSARLQRLRVPHVND